MKKACVLAIAMLVGLAPLAAALGGTVEGTIRKINRTEKSMVVAEAGGKETTVFWSDATKVEGGDPKEGEKVTVKAIEKDGKTCATWIHVGAWSEGVR